MLSPEEDIADELRAVTVEGLTMTEEFSKAADKIAFICSKRAVTQEKETAVEKATRRQNQNPKWSLFRQERISASNFGPVLKTALHLERLANHS